MGPRGEKAREDNAQLVIDCHSKQRAGKWLPEARASGWRDALGNCPHPTRHALGAAQGGQHAARRQSPGLLLPDQPHSCVQPGSSHHHLASPSLADSTSQRTTCASQGLLSPRDPSKCLAFTNPPSHQRGQLRPCINAPDPASPLSLVPGRTSAHPTVKKSRDQLALLQKRRNAAVGEGSRQPEQLQQRTISEHVVLHWPLTGLGMGAG